MRIDHSYYKSESLLVITRQKNYPIIWCKTSELGQFLLFVSLKVGITPIPTFCVLTKGGNYPNSDVLSLRLGITPIPTFCENEELPQFQCFVIKGGNYPNSDVYWTHLKEELMIVAFISGLPFDRSKRATTKQRRVTSYSISHTTSYIAFPHWKFLIQSISHKSHNGSFWTTIFQTYFISFLDSIHQKLILCTLNTL